MAVANNPHPEVLNIVKLIRINTKTFFSIRPPCIIAVDGRAVENERCN